MAIILLVVLMNSLLIAETMTVHFNNRETIGFDTAEIEEITFEPNTSVEEMVEFISQIPIKFLKNYPNPFNPIRGREAKLSPVATREITFF